MIRLATESDAAGIAAIYAPIVASSPISFETEPPTPADMAKRVRDTLVKYPWLVYDDGGEVAGYAYATTHRVRAAYQWSVETSVYVGERFRRRGIGQQLYAALFQVLTAQGYVNAYAGITLPNPASVALHEAVGFTPLGVYHKIGYKVGAWYDVGWWERSLAEYPSAPSAPRLLADVVADPTWEDMLSVSGSG
jgi:phosphinothricin acetyltransferase